MLRWHVVSAVFWRNVKQYFSGPLGYLFIVLFVTVSAFMAFSPQFFADNLATLDQLSQFFPLLLLAIVPAITMSVWAEEKRQGTDAILFTLPASDLDILIGKFLSVVAVYTVALAFSLTQVILLGLLGTPDWGVVVTTYLGYWLAGIALLSIGMFASSFSDNTTVAYVVGSGLCAIPVLIGRYFSGYVGIERFGIDWNLRDFTLGIIPLANVVYFLALTIFMLYLNLIVVSKRRWSRGQQVTLAGQYFIRAIALAVALISTGFLCNTAASSSWSRVDLTAEKLYTLDDITRQTLQKVIDDDRQVTIQAFVSNEVPRQYVDTKKQFVGLLRQFNEYGKGNVSVRMVNVLPNSDEALNAKRSGIEPEDVRSNLGGKSVEQEVFLGARISTSLGDAIVPSVDDSTALEYELSRALASTIDKKNKLTIGLLETDAFFGGPEFQGRRVPWSYNQTLEELKKQFKVKYYQPSQLNDFLPQDDEESGDDDQTNDDKKETKKKEPPHVLIVADPSSLDDMGMDALVSYVQAGHPTLIMADPLPFFWAFQNPRELGVLNAPRMSRVSPQSPYRQILASSPMPKSAGGTATKLMNALGIQWNSGACAWSVDNPHQSFSGQWPEALGARWPELYGPYEKAFVWVRDKDTLAFNAESPITAGLGEMLLFYPGSFQSDENSEIEFTPLITLGKESGATPWEELTITPQQKQQMLNPRTGEITTRTTNASSQITGNDLVVMNPTPNTVVDDREHVLAAHLTKGDELNVVVIGDMDFVSDIYYTQQDALNESIGDRRKQKIDNLAFFQNAIEVLAGNDSFVRLRNRRAKPRTLTRLEQVITQFREKTAREEELAEAEMEKQLKLEQDKLDELTSGIQSDTKLNFLQKIQKTGQEAMVAQRRFELKKQRLDKQLATKLEELKTKEQALISDREKWTRYLSIALAPLPALLLGIFVLWYRKMSEERGIQDDRRV